MAYISAEEVREIRKTLKTEFPKVKFSVRKDADSSKVYVTILTTNEPELNFLDDENVTKYGYIEVNHYWISENYEGEKRDFLNRILEIIRTAPSKINGREWYHETDLQSDYHDTAYYISISIGNYKKPYKFTGEKAAAAA